MSDTENAWDLDRAARVRSWYEGAKKGPVSLEISPTWACNVNCLFCRRKDELKDYYRKEKDLTDAQWVGVISQALASGTRRIMVRGGGDPILRRSLLHKLFPLVSANPQAEFLILTNGTLIDERLAEGFCESGWAEIQVSLHGGTPETHDYVTDQPGAFAMVDRSLSFLTKARRKRGTPRLMFHSVITRRSYAELDAFIDFAMKHEVEHVGFFPMHNPPYPNFTAELTMRPDDEKRFADLVTGHEERLKQAGISYCFQMSYQGENKEISHATIGEVAAPPPRGHGPETLPCFFPWHHASITALGAMAPCCYGENLSRDADLHQVSFDAAWLGGDMGRYRAMMERGESPEFCARCPNWYQRDNARLRPLVGAPAEARP